jgi:predicted nucleic acid-binding protein
VTGYLLDTNIVSAFAPGKQLASPRIASWFERQADHLFLSVVSVIEIEAGVCKLRRTGAGRRADDLWQWFGQILDVYGDRVIPLDTEIGRTAGAMADSVRAAGYNPGLADITIAATADVRRLTVLTRNTKHFAPIRVPVLDPFELPR